MKCSIFTACVLFFVSAFGASVSTVHNSCRCIPGESCWPSAKVWQNLAKEMTGKLVMPISPVAACHKDVKSAACQAALRKIRNPFYLQSAPGNAESQGWMNAWHTQASTYAAEVANTKDIVAAVNFARKHNLRLVIKGAGHDYLGRSSAPNSLMIWTHNMRQTSFNKNFVAQGCHTKGLPAVKVGAGTRWIEAYTQATTKHDMYVQGGGCTTVGAAGGFPQGGGFGSYSKEFGTGAGGILQATVVTANGKILVANQCQNQNLFWAIRGGGGSTFGVVSSLTLLAHPLPKHFGVLRGTITAKDSAAYHALVRHFLNFYIHRLNNPSWGEQFAFLPNNTIKIFMMSQGLTDQQSLKVWQPLVKWIHSSHRSYTIGLNYIDIPPNKMWNYDFWHKHYPNLVVKNTGPNSRPGEYWWAPNSGEVFAYWYTYQSWWLPKSLFNEKRLSHTADVIYKASRLAPVSFHINKGLAGASKMALRLSKETSTNPSVYNAAALVIMSAGTSNVLGHRNTAEAQADIARINKAMHMIESLAPNAGAYANEANYFQKNWQSAFWGSNYSKLLKLKNKYDPKGLFYCHHCVGSEYWTKRGMCRVGK